VSASTELEPPAVVKADADQNPVAPDLESTPRISPIKLRTVLVLPIAAIVALVGHLLAS